jgi:hypothetical protein
MTLRALVLLPLFALLALTLSPKTSLAEPFWLKKIFDKRVEADPNADYKLTDNNGPWLIVATTFSGEGSEEQSRELVLELRKRYNLEAYTHSKTFDFTGTVAGRGLNKFGDQNIMHYRRDIELHEIAVLVGNFTSHDDPLGQTTLDKIKRMRPDSLDPVKRGSTSQTLAALRRLQQEVQRAVLKEGDERRLKGPMGKAFISRNPLLPKEFFVQQGLEDFVVRMNEPAQYSLLKCPGQYTLKVATFNGNVILDQKKVQAFESGKGTMESNLIKAAENAEEMTYALRAKGYEAYSFHDRTSSIVTIGSFNSTGIPRANGTVETNPQINQLIKTFAGDPVAGTGGCTVKKILGISFDTQPEIIHVPRAAPKQNFADRMWGR